MIEDWMLGPQAPALVFASHNLGQVKRLASRVVYIEAGRILADLPVHDFFDGPLESTHPLAHAFVRGVSA
jgi:tungstate transport system ATP-binding protein